MPTLPIHECNNFVYVPPAIPYASESSKQAFLVIALLMTLVAGCSKPVEKVEDIRPVRVITLAPDTGEVVTELPGEVRARVESKLGFRVGGKIIARRVDVGSSVKRGQVLMQLDPQDLALAQLQAKAGLSAAESNRDLAKADFNRYQDLREKNFVAAAVVESKETAFKAAQAAFEQAQAALKNQSNQSGYTSLVADVDGVVTAVNAEVGQVVSSGTPVVQVAQSGALEVVVGIPEDKVNAIRQISDIRVRLWANPEGIIPAKLRELSPIADPVTRTYTAKLALPDSNPQIKLGMTAYAMFVAKNSQTFIKVPLTALFHDKNTTFVWIVEAGAVKLAPVVVSGAAGQDVLLSAGVTAGQTVVTAGVNLLKPGQKVSILGIEPAKNDGGSTISASTSKLDAGASK